MTDPVTHWRSALGATVREWMDIGRFEIGETDCIRFVARYLDRIGAEHSDIPEYSSPIGAIAYLDHYGGMSGAAERLITCAKPLQYGIARSGHVGLLFDEHAGVLAVKHGKYWIAPIERTGVPVGAVSSDDAECIMWWPVCQG